ncbi:sulfatase-like hydrolase/transferase [Niabella ginsengisoli]|uniref:sulfatase-like hydrolase/transferase n=1 Tax=Niabella ginsengisoli TaxID=522298 RepID=UPI0021D411B2|nr:sulfatase-like hydrolase/transferase [Niabella ginsengisoli]
MFRFSLFLIISFYVVSAAAQTDHPNIIFILADDLGYGDISSLNEEGKIKTPNVDRIAHAGIRFTDAHTSSSVCTPSRYGILTGRYNWRGTLKSGVLRPYEAPLIRPDRTTMASMLKQKGYQTACIGKWHLGFNWKTKDGAKPVDTESKNNLDYKASITGGPVDIGFDYFLEWMRPIIHLTLLYITAV